MPCCPSPPAFWEPFVSGLRAFVARRVPLDDAADVLQEILLRLHTGAGALRHDERAESWVYGIARRTIADFYRRRGRLPLERAEVDEAPDPEGVLPENLACYGGEHAVHEEVLSWLRPMAEDLPEAYRRALLMADFEGYSQQAVAEALGLTLSGAKSRIQRARALLGDTLRACCEVDFGPDARATAFRRLDRSKD